MKPLLKNWSELPELWIPQDDAMEDGLAAIMMLFWNVTVVPTAPAKSVEPETVTLAPVLGVRAICRN